MAFFTEELKTLGEMYIKDQKEYYERLKTKVDDIKMFDLTCKGLRSVRDMFNVEYMSNNDSNYEDFSTEEKIELLQAMENKKKEIIQKRND